VAPSLSIHASPAGRYVIAVWLSGSPLAQTIISPDCHKHGRRTVADPGAGKRVFVGKKYVFAPFPKKFNTVNMVGIGKLVLAWAKLRFCSSQTKRLDPPLRAG